MSELCYNYVFFGHFERAKKRHTDTKTQTDWNIWLGHTNVEHKETGFQIENSKCAIVLYVENIQSVNHHVQKMKRKVFEHNPSIKNIIYIGKCLS